MKDIIDKAVKGGFDLVDFSYEYGMGGEIEKIAESIFDHDTENMLIFRHDFLKGFFGEGKTQCPTCKSISKDETCCGDPVSWQYHAQQLVLSTDRKEYLKRFI